MSDDAVEANLALTRRAYHLWDTGGPDAAVEHVWAPDVVFHDPPEFPDARVYHGAEAVATRFREFMQAGGHFQHKLRSLEGRGDYVLAAIEMRTVGAASGAPTITTLLFNVVRYEASRWREFYTFLEADQARGEYERLAGPPSS